MKYIDADKLIAEIERRKVILDKFKDSFESAACCKQELEWIKGFINSLQQEQPMPDSTKLIELWHEDKEMLKEKDFRDDPWRLAYNAFMCGFGRGIAVNKQEQTEVVLENYLENYFKGWHVEEEIGLTKPDGWSCIVDDLKGVARHFYELGLNARKED